jgi:hypothetical protein
VIRGGGRRPVNGVEAPDGVGAAVAASRVAPCRRTRGGERACPRSRMPRAPRGPRRRRLRHAPSRAPRQRAPGQQSRCGSMRGGTGGRARSRSCPRSSEKNTLRTLRRPQGGEAATELLPRAGPPRRRGLPQRGPGQQLPTEQLGLRDLEGGGRPATRAPHARPKIQHLGEGKKR